MGKKVAKILVVLMFAGMLAAPLPAAAQDGGEVPSLRLRRDFGYSAGVEMQGKFTLILRDSESWQRVEFFVDQELVYSDVDAPFEYTFRTEEFGLGAHAIHAAATTPDGVVVESATITREFVTAEQGWKVAGKIALPILGFSLPVTLFGVGGPMLLGGKQKRFELGSYGPMGGAVCVRCGFPFSRPFFAPNLLVGKLVRCPHCGKVAVRPAAAAAALSEAEGRFRARGQSGVFSGESDEDALRRCIEDSRYE